MKRNRILLPALLVLLSTLCHSQSIYFRSGTVTIGDNLRTTLVDSISAGVRRFKDKALLVLRFNTLPTEAVRQALSGAGVELLEYIPDRAYTATVSGRFDQRLLRQAGITGLLPLLPEQKVDPDLAAAPPARAIKIAGTVDVWISFPKTFAVSDVIAALHDRNVDILSTRFSAYRVLSLRIASTRIKELAAEPFVDYVQAAPSEDQPLNANSRAGSRATVLNADVANGGRGLNGEGVVLGIGDNADVANHLDFAGRLIDRAAQLTSSGHGHHTTGTMAGAGNVEEQFRGYAPKATIVSQGFQGIFLYAPSYVQDYGMVVTNNSYGDNIECSYYGTYDLYSRLLDQQAFDLPNLQHVFSAGNSGSSVCAPFGLGYHTVLGAYQSAKNVITVGATSDSGLVAPFSSRGPVRDGRTKPEIVAMGQNVISAWPTNIYANNNGTSMSGPAVAGGLGLLYQRYRQLHGGANPKNGLMKALLCNGATDRGNAGPDFQYGFGWMNLLRSVEMMEANHYFTSSISTGGQNNHTITVPANTAQLKVMLYWNDPAASPLSAHTLVNDLDLQVTDPSLGNTLPKILDTSNTGLSTPAVTGGDHINNMEQVVINAPAAGAYTLSVKGTAVPQGGPQEYYLVYDAVPTRLALTSPVGGEALIPSTASYTYHKITWDATGYPSGTVNIDYSIDGGATWSSIAAGLDINRSVYTWIVPNVATSQALVRITNTGNGQAATSNPFTIISQPTLSAAAPQCEGYINLSWTAVSGATDYEVMLLQGSEMKSMAVISGTSYLFHGLSKDTTYAVSVRARINGKPGRRASALIVKPNSGSCSGSYSDNDLKLDAIVAPKSGRKLTSTELGAASAVTVRIRNLDDAAISNFTVRYSINGSLFVSETCTASVPGNSSALYTFNTAADLSATGQYAIVAIVSKSGDPEPLNDTARAVVKQIDNQPLVLPFLDDLESATATTYTQDTVGFGGIERYDLTRSTAYGRARTFVNSGMAYSGSKALTLDAYQYYAAGNINYLIGTFNLSGYKADSNDLRLDFLYNSHGQSVHNNDRVWIRGNDSQPWIQAFDLDNNIDIVGQYKKAPSIELAHLLFANGQSLGTSLQVRWGQEGNIAATDPSTGAGFSFDDLRIYEAVNDLQAISLDSPIHASCGLTNASVIKLSVRNASNAARTSIPVKYRINGGAWVSDVIPSIASGATVSFSFGTPADLSAFGTYTIQSVVDEPTDNFHDNDTVTATITNTPVISGFPYLQNFEGGNGYWYTGGRHSTWEYGTPASNKIVGAASGAKAWKTRLSGNYNDLEQSYLYSPCFDLTGLTNPTLSFSVALDLEDCGTSLCDAAWVEYSADGVNWTKLGAMNNGTNWYNKSNDVWSVQDYTRWHVATIPLPAGLTRLRLRFVLSSDPATNREGIAIDDIHVYGNTMGIYDGATMASPATAPVSNNGWVDITSGGKLVASLHPAGQDLGSTAVQAFINTAPVRYTSSQYYHDHNITIKPANALTDSVAVRFYFLDSETERLLQATGCAGCAKPTSAYGLGVSKYTDPDRSFENGTISDNQQGAWTYLTPASVAKVPFDKGYYAEFKVRNFSEFWLNNGAFNQSTALPVALQEFTARRAGTDAALRWTVSGEQEVLRYEIEVARGNDALQRNAFVSIVSVPGLGNTTGVRIYTANDEEANKAGPRYYRLKIVSANGNFRYSDVRPVVFDGEVLWQLYPNPSTGVFNLTYQLNSGELLSATVVDAKGSVILRLQKPADGFLQKLRIDLSGQPSGVYLLRLKGSKEQTIKMYKE